MTAAFDFLKKLQAEYIASFDEKILDLTTALQNENWESLRGLLHKLAGSGKTYQLDGISESAKKIETHLEATKAITVEAQENTLELVELLKKIKSEY